MTLDEFWAAAGEAHIVREGAWRWGQTLFNVLNVVRPDVANNIRGTVQDPFHWDAERDTTKFDAFYEFLKEIW